MNSPGTGQIQARQQSGTASIAGLLETQRRVLEMVATDHPLQDVLDELCREVERLVPAAVCSVMRVDGDRLRMVSSPSLPAEVAPLLEYIEFGAGSCGAAAQSAEMVVVADTRADHRWVGLRDVVERLGVAACWSVPIISREHEVLGTFAISHFRTCSPDEEQRSILETSAHIAAIAIARERMERSLRSTEATYRTIYESVNDAIFVHDLETGAILDVNPRMCEMFQCTREEALRINIGEIGGDEEHGERQARGKIQLAASGAPQVFEWPARRPNGTSFWVEVSLKRVTIAGEDRVLAVVRDVSQRRAAEQALRESESMLRSITENVPDHVMLLDLDTRIHFINRTVSDLTPEGVIGGRVYSFVEQKFWANMRTCFRRVLETGEPSYYEVEYHTEDGGTRTFESRVGPVERDGEIVAFAVLSTDVTERKQAALAIMESEERFRQLTEAITDVFWLTDWKTRRVVYVSPSYEQVWGRSCESLYDDARSWSEPIHPADIDRVSEAFYAGAERGEYDIEYRIIHPDGKVRWIHDKAFPIRGSDNKTVIRMAGVSEDITERKEAEEELRRRGEAERILRCELDHRVRNNLASLVTLIEISRLNAKDMESFAGAIMGRVNAMATIHSFLSRTSWSEIELSEMIDALTPPDVLGLVECEGAPVRVPAYQCNSLAVVLHELLHNSMKHGALGANGRVRLSWDAKEEGDDRVRLRMRWRESGGGPIDGDPTPGIGSSLIEGLVNWDLDGEVRFGYPAEGADHEMIIVLKPA